MSNTTASAKPPVTIWLFFIASWLLGWWLTFDGLQQRLWGHWAAALALWTPWLEGWGLTALDVGWSLVVAGLGLVGASFGLYLRRDWGYRTGLVVALLALGYGLAGAALGLVCLILLLLPATRAYLAQSATNS